MSDFKPPERKKTALDNSKLRLQAPCPSAEGKMSSMGFQLVSNNPRIVVNTNDPADEGNNYGRISANMDLPAFVALLKILDTLIKSPSENKYSIQCLGHTFFKGQRSQEKKILATVWVGRDKEGVLWISVTSENRPKIKFPFGPAGGYHSLHHADGSPCTASEVSEFYAKAFLSILEQMIVNVAVDNYVPPEPRNNGGFNKGSNGGGGYQKQSAPAASNFDDDIPY